MPSLNWILVLTLALLHYQAAYPTPITTTISPEKWEHHHMRKLKNAIGDLSKIDCRENDSTFYSPSNVESACIESALNCSMNELNATLGDCSKNKTNRQDFRSAIGLIGEILKGRPNTAQPIDCKQCEEYEEKSYKEFLKSVSKLATQLHLKPRATSAT